VNGKKNVCRSNENTSQRDPHSKLLLFVSDSQLHGKNGHRLSWQFELATFQQRSIANTTMPDITRVAASPNSVAKAAKKAAKKAKKHKKKADVDALSAVKSARPGHDKNTLKKVKTDKSTGKPSSKRKKRKHAEESSASAIPGESAEDFLKMFDTGLKAKRDRQKELVEEEKRIRARAKAKREREAYEKKMKPVRYDDDGTPIYSVEQLRIGKGGGTKDCPFDCWCCF